MGYKQGKACSSFPFLCDDQSRRPVLPPQISRLIKMSTRAFSSVIPFPPLPYCMLHYRIDNLHARAALFPPLPYRMLYPKKYSILGIALPLIPRYLCHTSCSSPHKLLFFNLLFIFLYLFPQLLRLYGNCGNITLNKHISVSETLTISTFPMKVDERPGHFPGASPFRSGPLFLAFKTISLSFL